MAKTTTGPRMGEPHRFSSLHAKSLGDMNSGRIYVDTCNPETGDPVEYPECYLVFEKYKDGKRIIEFFLTERFNLYQFGLELVRCATYECIGEFPKEQG